MAGKRMEMDAEVDVDVLMVTHRRADYIAQSLPRLLQQCDGVARVWLWHNGEHPEVLALLDEWAPHPAVAAVHRSAENVGQREPINWLFENARGRYVSKVDDDCLMADGWIEHLRSMHEAAPELGVVGTWRFQPEDFDAALAAPKIVEVADGWGVLRNHWVQGSGFLMKRACVLEEGPLREREMLPSYFTRLGLRGWTNGFAYPFVREDHMDDPRSSNTALHTAEDLVARMPLTAGRHGMTSLEGWIEHLQRTARSVQTAPLEPKHYRGWRRALARVARRLHRVVGG
jgi:hypothetical protein